jgi:hypothetical protein
MGVKQGLSIQCKGHGSKWSRPDLRYQSGNLSGGLRKTMKRHQDMLFPAKG